MKGYSGPAFRVGAGVQASDILKAAADRKHMVVTGICDVSWGVLYSLFVNKWI